MKITMNSTNDFLRVNGVRCRIWEGISDEGILTIALIVRVAPMNAH